MAITLKCKKHPKYKAVRRPVVACEACYALWIAAMAAVREG